MKILFFSHYFPPEVNAPATRTYQHCRRWVEAGHDVTVITCVPNCPDGVVYEGYRSRFGKQVEYVDGIRVVRIWTLLAANAGHLFRILNYLSYQFSAILASLRLERPDVVVATSPQLFCGWAGIWASRLKRTKLVLEIRDIWPESIAAVGAMRKQLGLNYLCWLEKRMYRAADAIVTVGTGYRDNVAGKVPEMADRLSVVTNGVDADQFVPMPPDQAFLDQHGLGGKFVCSYVGTVGMAHGLGIVIRSAKQLREIHQRDDIAFLIVGDGACREDLQRQAVDEGVEDRVVFTGRLPKEAVQSVLASSDCCLVHLRGTKLFSTVIPSKIFETMAMKRPIIMGVKGPAREIVMESECGAELEPDDENELSTILIRMADDRDATEAMGGRAREFVIENYNRDGKAEEMLRILEQVACQSESETQVGVEPPLGVDYDSAVPAPPSESRSVESTNRQLAPTSVVKK